MESIYTAVYTVEDALETTKDYSKVAQAVFEIEVEKHFPATFAIFDTPLRLAIFKGNEWFAGKMLEIKRTVADECDAAFCSADDAVIEAKDQLFRSKLLAEREVRS